MSTASEQPNVNEDDSSGADPKMNGDAPVPDAPAKEEEMEVGNSSETKDEGSPEDLAEVKEEEMEVGEAVEFDPLSNKIEEPVVNGEQRTEGTKRQDVLDLTSKSSTPSGASNSPDIIVLSDEDEGMMNGDKVNGHENIIARPKQNNLSEEDLKDKRKLLYRLHEELRNEEMKLILLKKLRQSQLTHALAPVKENVPQNKQNSSSIVGRGGSNSSTHSSNTPPPLVRGNGTPSTHLHSKSIIHPSHHHQHHSSNSARQQSGQSSNPPTLLMGSRSNQSSISIHRSSSSRSSPSVSITHTAVNSKPHSQNSHHDRNSDNGQQTPAQRQAAAKLALRKQLEKTLLQIPPPKPPPPEMHFIPNASNQEFICLVGLETIVNLLIDDPSLKRPPPAAFFCVQCGTDFTPVWKWDNTAKNSKSGGVICENCLTSNQKKAAKAEHTNRLKTAFVKALQQEQEIEQRMSQTASPTQHQQHSSSKSSRDRSESSDRHHRTTSSHQSFLQAHHQMSRLPHGGSQGTPPTAHMLPFNPLLAPHLYSGAYQIPHSKASDLQRQYLLDMIPTPRSMPSIPQGTHNWKI